MGPALWGRPHLYAVMPSPGRVTELTSPVRVSEALRVPVAVNRSPECLEADARPADRAAAPVCGWGAEGPGCDARGRWRGLAAVPVGGGGAWPGFETTRRAKLAARTARGRAAAHGHTKQPGRGRSSPADSRPAAGTYNEAATGCPATASNASLVPNARAAPGVLGRR